MGELWDVYDINRNKLDKVHERGKPLVKEEYYLIINVWIMDSNNRILLTKRHPDKTWGNYWECTGGFVKMGEDSLQGAVREVAEEIGIKLNYKDGILISQDCKDNYLIDSWLFKKDIDLKQITFQKEEVIDAKLVNDEEGKKMCNNRIVTPNVRNFYRIYYDKYKK